MRGGSTSVPVDIMRPFGGGSQAAFANGADFPRADFTQTVQRLTGQARPGRANPVRLGANPGARGVARWTQFLPVPTPKLLRKDEALQRLIPPPTAKLDGPPRRFGPNRRRAGFVPVAHKKFAGVGSLGSGGSKTRGTPRSSVVSMPRVWEAACFSAVK